MPSQPLWLWPDFSARELGCTCCGEQYTDVETLNALQILRTAWGKPIVINSGHRCKKHNKAVGGVSDSIHLRLALDCRCPAEEQNAFVAMAKRAGFRGVGRYPGRGFIHLDMGRVREWLS